MPAPAEVGHGRFGARSGLRPFEELPSQARKDAFIEIEAGQLVTGWTLDISGNGYHVSWMEEFDGQELEAIGVRSLTETLVRQETANDCMATDGSFCHFPRQNRIYIRLTLNANPTGQDILVTTAFGFCTGGVTPDQQIQPMLGRELLTDSDVEAWTTSTNLTSWTETLAGGGFALTRDAAVVFSGTYSVALTATGAAAGSATFSQIGNLTIGRAYRACGYYRTPFGMQGTQKSFIRYGTTTALSDDGRTAAATLTDGVELLPTGGAWRFFVYDFIAHENDASLAFRMTNVAIGLGASLVNFDKLSLKQINGWRHYQPRIAKDGIPQVTIGGADVYPGSEEVGNGLIRLVNDGNATLERLFSPPWYYLSRDVRVLHGGVFPGGQEILYNDLEPGFAGRVAGDRPIEVSDSEASLQVEDFRGLLMSGLPTRVYGAGHPACEARDVGRPRPLAFGLVPGVRPTGISLDGATGYRNYEVVDTTDWPTGFGGVGPAAGGTVWAYVDEEAADKRDAAKRVALSNVSDYSTNGAAGTMSILHDVRVITINRENNKLDFHIGGAALVATIPDGVYIIGNGSAVTATFRRGLLEQIRVAMTAASGQPIGAIYTEATHKVTIARATGVLSLLWNTGVNDATSIGPTLGFDGGADDVGTTSYVGDSPLFTDPDSTHVIRADVAGFADDAAGTYTGVAGNTLQKAPDILRFLLLRVLKMAPTRIDLPSFLAARTSCPQALAVYLGGLASISDGGFDLTVQEVIDRLEAGAFADCVMDGVGRFYFIKRTATVPVTAPSVYEREMLDFRGYYAGEDVFGTVRVNYSQDPVTGMVKGAETAITRAQLLYGRPQLRTWDTFLSVLADAAAASTQLAVLAQAAIRHFDLTISNTRALRLKVGDLFRITRSQALQGVGESGGLNAAVFRVMFVRKDFADHLVQIICHTNIV